MTKEIIDFKKRPAQAIIITFLAVTIFIVLLLNAIQYYTSTHCYQEIQFSDGTIDSCELITNFRSNIEITNCKSGLEYKAVTNYKVLRTFCESD